MTDVIEFILLVIDRVWIWPVYSLLFLLVAIIVAGKYALYQMDNRDSPYVDRPRGKRPDWKNTGSVAIELLIVIVFVCYGLLMSI